VIVSRTWQQSLQPVVHCMSSPWRAWTRAKKPSTFAVNSPSLLTANRLPCSVVWARIHKVDRVRPQADGSAIILVEDERTLAQMSLVQGLSITIAIARVLNAKRALELKYGGKGGIRYCSGPSLPDWLLDAVTRAGASTSDRSGETVRAPASPASVAATIDQAFNSFAYHLRSSVGATDLASALKTIEYRRRKAVPIDREDNPAAYWSAVFELAALAGEVSRAKGGRWVDTKDMPVPFALKFPEGALAYPSKLAIQIVEGTAPEEESLSPGPEPAGPTS
jgi:hypothetical protein